MTKGSTDNNKSNSNHKLEVNNKSSTATVYTHVCSDTCTYLKSNAQSLHAEVAVTEAARAVLYISANSPKHPPVW